MNTIIDFWRMVWQENVHQIIMLTNIIEDGKVGQCRYYDNRSQLTSKYISILNMHFIFCYILVK